MSRQSFCLASYTLGVLALFFMDASIYTVAIALALMVLAFSQPIMLIAMRFRKEPDADEHAEMEALQRRLIG